MLQYRAAWENLVAVLAAAAMTPANIVRLNIYTTDVEAFMARADQTMPIHMEAGARVACTLLGVAGLYDPAIMVELEATAVA